MKVFILKVYSNKEENLENEIKGVFSTKEKAIKCAVDIGKEIDLEMKLDWDYEVEDCTIDNK